MLKIVTKPIKFSIMSFLNKIINCYGNMTREAENRLHKKEKIF